MPWNYCYFQLLYETSIIEFNFSYLSFFWCLATVQFFPDNVIIIDILLSFCILNLLRKAAKIQTNGLPTLSTKTTTQFLCIVTSFWFIVFEATNIHYVKLDTLYILGLFDSACQYLLRTYCTKSLEILRYFQSKLKKLPSTKNCTETVILTFTVTFLHDFKWDTLYILRLFNSVF